MDMSAPAEKGRYVWCRWWLVALFGLLLGVFVAVRLPSRSEQRRLCEGSARLLTAWLLEPLPDGAVLFIGDSNCYQAVVEGAESLGRTNIILVDQLRLLEPGYLDWLKHRYSSVIWGSTTNDLSRAFEECGRILNSPQSVVKAAASPPRLATPATGNMVVTILSQRMATQNRTSRECFTAGGIGLFAWMPSATPIGMAFRLDGERESVAFLERNRAWRAKAVRELKGNPQFCRDNKLQEMFGRMLCLAAQWHKDRGLTNEAEAVYHQVIELAPKWSGGYYYLAQRYLEQDRFDDALALMKRLRKTDAGKEETGYFSNTINTCRSAAQKETELEVLCTAQPTNLAIHVQLLRVYLQRGHYDKLFALAESLTNATNLKKHQIVEMIPLMLQAIDLPRAKRLLVQLGQTHSDTADPWLWLALVLAAENDCDGAVAALSNVKDWNLSPGDLGRTAGYTQRCRDHAEYPKELKQLLIQMDSRFPRN